MKRRRGDGVAVVGILVGAALAWAVTGAVSSRGTSGAAHAAEARAVATLVAVTAQAAAADAAVAEATAVEVTPAHGTRTAVGDGGVAFRASSLKSGFSVQGDYGGRLTRDGDGLRVRVPVARIRNSPGYVREDALLIGVRLLLTEEAEGGRVVREGRLHRVQELLTPGEELWLTDLELELDGVTEEEARDGWLVIEHVLGWRESGAPRSVTYAPAPGDILWLLFDWEEDGC